MTLFSVARPATFKVPRAQALPILFRPNCCKSCCHSRARVVVGCCRVTRSVCRTGGFVLTGNPESAGINRHVVGDARALQERK